jgi:SAM-dependent methyltransferase
MGLPWFLESRLRRHWPELFPNQNTAEHWNDAWARHGAGDFRASTDLPHLRTLVVAALPEAGRVLDVGCGTGETLVAIRSAHPHLDATGVDISPVAVDRARAAGFAAEVAVLPDLPFPDATFDAIACMETLEHVSDAAGSVRSFARVLKPGGRLVLTVPNGAHDLEPIHVHRWTESRLRRLLSSAFSAIVIQAHTEKGEQSLLAQARR